MSGIPLEYWTGLGAVTAESLAAQGMEAQRKADALRNVPGQAAQADAFQRQADSLFAQARAAGAARTANVPAPAPRAQARPATPGGRVLADPRRPPLPSPRASIPTYTIPQRRAFGFDSKLAPLTDLFRPQGPSQGYQPPLSITQVPTWAWVAAGTITLLLVGGAVKKRFAS